MSVKQDILDKLERLKEISPDEGASFFTPLINAIDTYFTSCSGYAWNVNECVHLLSADIYRRNIVHEREYERKMRTDYPVGYFNLWECFYNAREILEADETEFVNSWVWELDPQPEPLPEPPPEPHYHIKENTMLTHWQSVLHSWQERGSSILDGVTDWCKHSGGNSYLVWLFEDSGHIVSQLTYRQIADIIYKDRHLKEVMSEFQIDAFMPSYE